MRWSELTSDSLEFLACQSGGAYLPMGLSTVLATVLDMMSYSWEMVTTTSLQATHCLLLLSATQTIGTNNHRLPWRLPTQQSYQVCSNVSHHFYKLIIKNNTEKNENIFKSEQIMKKDLNLNEAQSEDCFVETPQFTLLFDQCAGTLETLKRIIKE